MSNPKEVSDELGRSGLLVGGVLSNTYRESAKGHFMFLTRILIALDSYEEVEVGI